MPLFSTSITNQKVNMADTSAPTSLTDGDIWYDSTQKALMMYINGISQGIVGAIFTQTATQTIAATITETTILGSGVGTLTLPANFFVAGKQVRIILKGVYSTPLVNLGNITVKIKLGSTVLASATANALLVNATNQDFDSNCTIICRTAGATGSVVISGLVNYSLGANTAAARLPINNGSTAVTIDTTSSLVLNITVTWSNNTTGNSISSLISVVEVLN